MRIPGVSGRIATTGLPRGDGSLAAVPPAGRQQAPAACLHPSRGRIAPEFAPGPGWRLCTRAGGGSAETRRWEPTLRVLSPVTGASTGRGWPETPPPRVQSPVTGASARRPTGTTNRSHDPPGRGLRIPPTRTPRQIPKDLFAPVAWADRPRVCTRSGLGACTRGVGGSPATRRWEPTLRRQSRGSGATSGHGPPKTPPRRVQSPAAGCICRPTRGTATRGAGPMTRHPMLNPHRQTPKVLQAPHRVHPRIGQALRARRAPNTSVRGRRTGSRPWSLTAAGCSQTLGWMGASTRPRRRRMFPGPMRWLAPRIPARS